MLRYGKKGLILLEQFRKLEPACKIFLMDREPDEQDKDLPLRKGCRVFE